MHLAVQLAIIAGVYGNGLILAILAAWALQPEIDTKKQRYLHLDGLRAPAALGVLASHLVENAYACRGIQESPDVAIQLARIMHRVDELAPMVCGLSAFTPHPPTRKA